MTFSQNSPISNLDLGLHTKTSECEVSHHTLSISKYQDGGKIIFEHIKKNDFMDCLMKYLVGYVYPVF